MHHTSLFHGDLVSSSRILYTPSAFARANLIHLQEIGRLQAQQAHRSGRQNLQSYLFFIVLSGTGTLEYGRTFHRLTAGDCVFLDCRHPYCHQTSEHLWALKWIHFYGPNMGNIYDKYTERGGRTAFHAKEPADFERLLDQLYQIADSSDYIRDMRIFEKITSLLTLLMDESWTSEQTESTPKRRNLQQIKDYLDLHYQEKISLDELAEMFYINKFYLSRIFKEQFGIPISHYLLQTRITHAKQLLRFTDQTMETIGTACGMSDGNYFTRVFKQVEGITPGEFRKLWVSQTK